MQQQKPGWIEWTRRVIGRAIMGMAHRSYSFFIPSTESGITQKQPISYKTAADDGYKKAVWVYRCVNEIANRVSSVPIRVFPRGSDKPITGKNPLTELLEKPNKGKDAAGKNIGQSWYQFMRAQSILMSITGNVYYDVSEKVGSKPANLYLLRPDRMKIVPGDRRGTDATKYIKQYEYYVETGVATLIPPEDIIHHKRFDPTNDWYGLSPLQVASYSVDTEVQASLWNYNVFRNQARPSGVLYTDQLLSDEQFTAMSKEINENWQGVNNAGRPVILEGGLKWAQLALSQRDADYILLKKLTREEICGVYGVPPVIVGILDRATYSNYEIAEVIFWSQTILPELTDFCDFWNVMICPMYGDFEIRPDLSDIKALKEAQDMKDKRSNEAFKSGIITQNEARFKLGWDPQPKGNFYLLPSSGLPWFEGEDVPGTIEQSSPEPAARSIQVCDTRAVILNPTKAQVAAFLKISAQRQEKYAKKLAKAVQSILSAQYQDAYRRVLNASGEPNAAAIAKAYDKEAKQALTDFYEDAYEDGLKYFINLTKKDLGLSTKGLIISGYEHRDQITDDLSDSVREWLEQVTGERVVAVTDYTKQQIKSVIEDGIRQGKTSKEIADEILDLDEIISYMRAARISVTETHSIAVAGNFYAMVDADLGEELEKIWHTNMDGRQRDPHGDIVGQRRKMDKPFNSGTGKKLMFPGDSSLGAGGDDIIHCRCVILYDTTKVGGFYGG